MTRPVVLNTRARDQAAELTTLLRAAGYSVLEIPAIEVSAAWDPLELSAIAEAARADAYAWLVLISQNAARFLAQGLGGQLPRTNILCGRATAQALDIDAAQTLERFSASAALAVLSPLVRAGERVLVPRAAEGREELVDGLRALGVQVDAPVCYRTLPAPTETFRALPTLAAVTFCSPSAVHATLAGMGRARLAATRLVCLGETTAAAARDADLHVARVARRTSLECLVSAVQSVAPSEVGVCCPGCSSSASVITRRPSKCANRWPWMSHAGAR
jgi:uroporphyrinogen-III synthase